MFLRKLLGAAPRVPGETGAILESPVRETFEETGEAPPEVVEMVIDGELDLHTFPPAETRAVVAAYIEEAHARGLREVRVVHGKGIGVQRRIVHALLDTHPLVSGYHLAGEGRGGWGATLVDLVPRDD